MYGTDYEPQPVKEAELEELLLRPATDQFIAEVLSRTNTQGMTFAGRLMGREYGFVAYGDLSERDRIINLSPLMEGQEGSVDIYDQLRLHFLGKGEAPKPHILDFHTHTHLWLQVSKELWRDPEALETDDREVDLFSRTDLKSEPSMLGLNPYLISAVGTERNGVGNILLYSLKDPNSKPTFDPLAVYIRSRQHLLSGADPLDAYREAGFNATQIKVDLSRQPVMSASDIRRASIILTQG